MSWSWGFERPIEVKGRRLITLQRCGRVHPQTTKIETGPSAVTHCNGNAVARQSWPTLDHVYAYRNEAGDPSQDRAAGVRSSKRKCSGISQLEKA